MSCKSCLIDGVEERARQWMTRSWVAANEEAEKVKKKAAIQLKFLTKRKKLGNYLPSHSSEALPSGLTQ